MRNLISRHSHADRHTAARGMMAMKLKENRRPASQLRRCEHIESGTKTRRMLSHDPKMKNRKEEVYDGSSFAARISTTWTLNGFVWPFDAPFVSGSRGVRSESGVAPGAMMRKRQ